MTKKHEHAQIPFLGEQILWEQLQPFGRLNQSDLNTNHPLRSILFRVAQLPPAKRNQAAQIFSNSRQVVAQSDINKGVSYLATQLLPILMPDHPVTRSSHLKTRAEKTKQMHADLKVFGWFLLTQNPYDQKMWVEQIEIKHKNQFSKRMLKDCMDYCCCCY